ncbi:AraC family transcriptional regulator [Hyphomicrobium sp. DY-1]|uniref:AraC family transcriptional regulator n=1 Tax=Hyphomicrobium sp. DY-1 TaxID=3075650 RepID=UPI0039C2885A
MNKDLGDGDRLERTRFATNVCDTEYCTDKQKFSAFRDAIANMGMPWRFEISPEATFEARLTSLEFERGVVARSKATPLIGVRSATEVANSDIDGFYICYLLTGNALVEQGGREVDGIGGSLMIFDGGSPVKVTARAEGCYDVLSLFVPKTHFSDLPRINTLLRNLSLPAERLGHPLSACLATLCDTFATATADEIIALYEASIALLPITAARWNDEDADTLPLNNRASRELLRYIAENLGNAELCPTAAAEHIGMSVRYLHRQFAINGTTFGSYVMSKRLEGVRRDLISETCERLPISAVAFRWGFNDLSTFIRAFKKRYGCTPRSYRANQ